MKNALVINTDFTTEVVELVEDELGQLQGLVGGWVQAIDLSNELSLWVNEEGKLNSLPYNAVATIIWENFFGVGTDIIVGRAVIIGGTDEDGETIGLTANQIRGIEIIAQNERRLAGV